MQRPASGYLLVLWIAVVGIAVSAAEETSMPQSIDSGLFVASGAEVRSFTKEAVIEAPAAKVYDAWATPEGWSEVYDPPSASNIDLAIGGRYECRPHQGPADPPRIRRGHPVGRDVRLLRCGLGAGAPGNGRISRKVVQPDNLVAPVSDAATPAAHRICPRGSGLDVGPEGPPGSTNPRPARRTGRRRRLRCPPPRWRARPAACVRSAREIAWRSASAS